MRAPGHHAHLRDRLAEVGADSPTPLVPRAAQDITLTGQQAQSRGTSRAYNRLTFIRHACPSRDIPPMENFKAILSVLDDVLSLGGRSASFSLDTPLLGAIPEIDSMAVVSLITTLEERFGITVEDDEIGGDTFATVGALTEFVNRKLSD